MLEFTPVPNATASPGLVLQVGSDNRFLRVTHVFPTSVYVMWIGAPESARLARRPVRKTTAEIRDLAKQSGNSWGRLTLPASLAVPITHGSDEAEALESAWALIHPIISHFEIEANLSRSRFTLLIRQRAAETETSFTSLGRLVLRYYYFGRIRQALLRMPPGVKPGEGNYATVSSSNPDQPPKRRGRKSILTQVLGSNDFIVSETDVEDMVVTLKGLLRKGPTHRTTAHEKYLAGAFRRRHQTLYKEYLANKKPEPVTYRQFCYYVEKHQLENDLLDNLITHNRNPGGLGSLHTTGPGELYEIDSTLGRLYLVSRGDDPIILGKPTIYLIIDRWSRFVVSVYLSLRPPSFEEVRHALLIAFTSRTQRFGTLGININDKRWPIGRMPAVICADRGSEYLSYSFEQSVVNDLRIELTELAPYCPDGKAIVERMIREIKRRMSSSGLKGTYSKRPLDPQTKKAAKKAELAAVHSLAEAYRTVIEIIEDHNHRPHRALKKRRTLAQAGIAPTPAAAYIWGVEHIQGLRTPPFNDTDYQRMLLATDNASLAAGVLRYKGRAYLPENEIALEIARNSSRAAKKIIIRVDKTAPYTIYVVNRQGSWASFQITEGEERNLAGITLDEEEASSSSSALVWAKAEHHSRVSRLAKIAASTKSSTPKIESATKPNKQQQFHARVLETESMKDALTQGNPLQIPSEEESTNTLPSWMEQEQHERIKALEIAKKQRSELWNKK